jgi:serine/threonine protein kinase
MSDIDNALPKGAILKSDKHAYKVEKVLGSGGFGITYLASANITVGNVPLKVNFAIKEHFINSDCERDNTSNQVLYSNPAKERIENSRKDFIAEAKRLQKVGTSHPNIVRVNEVFEANNTAYYVMEYLDGKSLRSYVKGKGYLTEKEMLSAILPITDAVGYLHSNKITHLDIKPDNIMLTNDEDGSLRPVLIDFGLSKHYDKNGRPTSSIKTLGCSDGYSPIEQYAGITTFSPTADIYSLGATMVFCLLGKDPIKSTDIRIKNVCETLKGRASDTILEALAHAMATSYSERTTSVHSLLNDMHIESFNPAAKKERSNETKPIHVKSNWKIKVKEFIGSCRGKRKEGYEPIPTLDSTLAKQKVESVPTVEPSLYEGKILCWDGRTNLYLWQTSGLTESAFKKVEHMHIGIDLCESFSSLSLSEFVKSFLSNGSTSFYEEYPIGFALNNMGDYNTIRIPENTWDFLIIFHSCNAILLPENVTQFLEALKLQYQLSLDKTYRHESNGRCIICSAPVLYAFGSLLRANGEFSKFFPANCIDDDTVDIAYNEYICRASWGSNLAEIESIEKKNSHFNQIASNSMLYLGGIYHLLNKHDIESHESSILLDCIEYKISIIIKKNKLIREVFDIINEDLIIPCRKSIEIPYDLLQEYDIYLKIGNANIPINHIKHQLASLDSRVTDKIVKLILDIDSIKTIWLVLCLGSKSIQINLGEYLSRYTPKIEYEI